MADGDAHHPGRDEGTDLRSAEGITGFAVMARAALADARLPCTDEDLELLAVVAQVLGPGLAALDAVDLGSLAPEYDLDPARAPR